MWARVVVGDSSAGPSLVLVPRLQQLDEENSELIVHDVSHSQLPVLFLLTI